MIKKSHMIVINVYISMGLILLNGLFKDHSQISVHLHNCYRPKPWLLHYNSMFLFNKSLHFKIIAENKLN